MKNGNSQNEPNDKFNKKYNKPKFSLSTFLGDAMGALKNFIFNPNSLYFTVLVIAGVITVLNMVPYVALFTTAIGQLAGTVDDVPILQELVLGGAVITATVLGAGLQVVVQGMEIMPVAPILIPQWAERLYFKSNRQRFEKPYEGDNAPTIIPKAYNWVRSAVEKNHEVGFLISLFFYGFDFWVCQSTYPVWDSVGNLRIFNLFFVITLVVGFVCCLRIAAIFNSHRLNSAEEAEFQVMKGQLMPPRYVKDGNQK
ncbi:MAG TPA: hypothetical protein DCE56_02440 [Cyanobacteria bacterium UBA8553]|nr:hypothetical protein [Cyanobacteria bacterium UBA8553]